MEGKIGIPVRKGKKATGRPAKLEVGVSGLVYEELRGYGVPVKRAKELAGLSSKNNTPVGSVARDSIAQVREKALKNLGIGFEEQIKWFKEKSDNVVVNAGDQISCRKEINRMVPGFIAPQEQQVSVRGVFVELAQMSSGELNELANLLGVVSSDETLLVSDAEYTEENLEGN
jgi:hypothetical protein